MKRVSLESLPHLKSSGDDLGEHEKDQPSKLEYSYYNLHFQLEGEFVVFNTLSSSIVSLPSSSVDDYLLGDPGLLPAPLRSQLVQQGVCIEAGGDETQDYLQKYECDKDGGNALFVKLLLVETCNFGCQYCYQNAPSKTPAKNGGIISSRNVEHLFDWLESEALKPEVESLDIELYGGEPTLAKKRFRQIFNRVDDLQSHSNKLVKLDIVTNGSLLDQALIKEFVQRKIRLQITLDGAQDTHDSRRFFAKGNKGSFDQIITNIKIIVAEGGAELVNLRMNVDRENIEDVPKVAKIASEIGVSNFNVGIVHFREDNSVKYKEHLISPEDMVKRHEANLYKIATEYGFARERTDLSNKTTCSFNLKNGYAVSPNLEVFKCDELIGQSEYRVGRIVENGKFELDGEELQKQRGRSPSDFDECRSCKLLPLCGSGCPVRALNTTGTAHNNYCETSYDLVREKVQLYLEA
jgi:uncharacterized protein